MTKKGEDLAMYHNYLVKGLVKLKMWQHEASKRRTAAAEKRKLEAEDAEERQLEAERHKDSFVTSLKFNARQALGLDPNHLTSVVHPGSSREDSVSEGEADSDTEADGAVAIPLQPAQQLRCQHSCKNPLTLIRPGSRRTVTDCNRNLTWKRRRKTMNLILCPMGMGCPKRNLLLTKAQSPDTFRAQILVRA